MTETENYDIDDATYNKKKIELWAPMFLIVYGTMAVFSFYGVTPDSFFFPSAGGILIGIGLSKIYQQKLKNANL